MAANWREHIRAMVRGWLVGETPDGGLGCSLLMLLGNPDLFRQTAVEQVLGPLEPIGAFVRGRISGRPVTLTRPKFGAPICAMYLEAAAMLGVQRVVAMGFTGGLVADVAIGSYFVAREALGFDGITASYARESAIDALPTMPPRLCPADAHLTDLLESAIAATGARWSAGRIATIDAIVLEDDAMVAKLGALGCHALEMETAAIYTVARRVGIAATSFHIVSDNPFLRETLPSGSHIANYAEGVEIAAGLLTSD
jgi:uridine phosphorylase